MRHPLLELILVALAASACGKKEDGIGCFPVDDTRAACPPAKDVSPDDLSEPWDCDNTVVKVVGDGSGTPEPAYYDGSYGCCYEVLSLDEPGGECTLGRLYREHGHALTASVPANDPWGQVAAGEHASIAAFAKLQLQLMAHGAPMDLVERVAEALRDEVRHTQVALGFSGLDALGPLPLRQAVDPSISLAELTADAVREGCVGETLSALLTRAAAEHAPTPAERDALHSIADDEDRHAALSWALVAWAVEAGGPEVEDAVRAAFAEPHPQPGFPLLDDEVRVRVLEEGLHQVLRPAAGALLAA